MTTRAARVSVFRIAVGILAFSKFLIAADDGPPHRPSSAQFTFDSPVRDVWVGPDDEFVAVGGKNFVAFADGTGPPELQRGFEGSPWSVWGTASEDVFVSTYNGLIYHFDGATWNLVVESSFGPWELWGSSERDVFAVGTDGAIMHFDGEDWSYLDSGVSERLVAVHGNSSTNVVAVGETGIVLRFNGKNWSRIETPFDGQINGVWVAGENDMFFVGGSGLIARFNGNDWTRMIPAFDGWFEGIHGLSDDMVVAVGTKWPSLEAFVLRFDGTSWSELDSLSNLHHFGSVAFGPSGNPYVAFATRESSEWKSFNDGLLIQYFEKDTNGSIGNGE